MLVEARGLTEDDLADIAALERRVVAADGGRLKLEWPTLRSRPDGAVNDLLWREGQALLGFLGLYGFGGPVELAGMVHPDARRRGIGTAMLRRALELAAERRAGEVLLVAPRATSAGAAFARARGGELEHSEHHLVLGETPPEPLAPPGLSLRPYVPADAEAVGAILTEAFGGEHTDLTGAHRGHLVVEAGGEVVGTVRLSSEGGSAGIYGFAVRADRRGEGIGGYVLRYLCAKTRAEGTRRVTLEVEVKNEGALRLYTAAGFEPAATEDYFRFSTSVRSGVRP